MYQDSPAKQQGSTSNIPQPDIVLVMRDLPNIRHVVLMRSLIGFMSVCRLQMQLMSVFTFALLAPLGQCENWQTCTQRQRDEISTNQEQDSHKTYVYCLVNLGT